MWRGGYPWKVMNINSVPGSQMIGQALVIRLMRYLDSTLWRSYSDHMEDAHLHLMDSPVNIHTRGSLMVSTVTKQICVWTCDSIFTCNFPLAVLRALFGTMDFSLHGRSYKSPGSTTNFAYFLLQPPDYGLILMGAYYQNDWGPVNDLEATRDLTYASSLLHYYYKPEPRI